MKAMKSPNSKNVPSSMPKNMAKAMTKHATMPHDYADKRGEPMQRPPSKKK